MTKLSYNYRILESDLPAWLAVGWEFAHRDYVLSLSEPVCLIVYIPVNGEMWPAPEGWTAGGER